MHIRQLKNRISVIAAILLTTAVPPTLALDGLGLVEVNAVWDITNFEVWSAPGQTGIQLTAPCTTVGVGLPTGSNQMDNPTGSDPEFPQSSNPLTENQWRWNGSGAAPCAGRSGQGYVGIVAATQGTVTVVDSAFFQVGTLTHYNIAVPGFPPTDFGNGAYVTLGLTGQYVFHDLTGPTPQNVQLVIDYGIEFNETLNVSSCLYPAADNSNGCADRTVIIGPAVPPTVTIGGSLVSIDVDQFLPLDTNGNCDTTATPASAFFTAEGGSTTGCAFGTVTTGNLQIDKVAVGGDTTFEIRHVELGQIQSDPPGNTQGQEVSTPIVTAVTTAGGAGSTGLLPTTPGFIKVEEVPASIPAGWEFESITCVDPDETFGPIYNANSTPWVNAVSETAALIDLDSVLASNSTLSEDIVCTFVNRKNPTITVTKVGSPSDSQSFDFTATSALNGLLAVDGITPDITDLSDDTLNDGLANGVDGGNAAGSFSLTADGTASSSMTFEVDAGDFTITEQVAAGRELTGLVCTATNFDGDPVTVTTVLATGVATITNLSWGDEVTCTYTNTEQALIVVGKALSPTTDSGIFDLSINGAVVVDEATHGDTNDGLGGNPAPIAVNIGEMITVTEIAGTNAPGTNLGNYNSTLTCSGGGVTDPGGTTSGSFEVPVSASGETITCTFTNTRKSAVFTLDKTWVSPVAGDVVNLLTATATNSISTTATAPAGAVAVNTMTVFAGETINFSEVAGLAATNLANYTTTWSCDGGATNTPGVSGTYTVPATPVAVTCTFTNTQNDTPVTLTKVWVGGITADAVSLAITGVTGSVAAVDGASIVDGAASDATATALVGDTVTLTEAFTTGDAGNYTKVLTCTSPTQLTAQEIAADALTGNYSVVVGDAGGPIACTFTNTQNDTPVTLTKVWVGGITADAVSLAITGVTGSVAAVDGASIVDGAASDATATALVGDTVTLTEAFTTGDAGNYTKVLTCTSPTQTAQVIAADALTGDYAVVVGDEGGPIACTFTNTQNDTPVTLTKVWVGGITADAVSLAITGVTGSVAAVDGASIVDGAASDATATALVGDTVTLTEAFTTGDAGNYTKVLTCTSPTQLTAQEIAADALTGNYSVVVGDAGGPIACTFTNTQNDTPVTLTKVWVGGITADAVSLAITGVTGSVAAVDGASIVDGAASDATATALVGDTVTLTEAFTTGDAGNYTKVLTCTSPTQLTAQEIAADALTGNYSVVVGDAGGPIACTFTNTQNDTPVTLTKVWVGGITADAVSLAITGVTGSVAAVDGASIVDGAASDATATALVGDTVTLTEAFTTGDAGNYTKVLTCTSPTQLTAQEIAADALTGNYSVVVGDAGGPIACTFTNTQNDTPVTLTKVWVGGITADAVSLAITGVTGSVAAVDGASIVDGAASDATATAFVGDTVTLTEAFTTGDAGNYTKVLTCTSPTQLTAQEIAADALTGNYSVVVGDAGGPIACTFTNTQNDTPVTLTKVWVGGITADAVSLAITGVTGSVAAVDGASIVDGAASDATATAFVGDTVTLTEAFTTGDAGNYTKVLTCTSPTQLTAQEIAADALTGNYSVVVGDAGGPIACTFTNTQNDTPVTLTKVWVGGITADAVSLAITGVTGSVAAVDGASIVDGAASDATATATALVGDTVTLTEAFTTGDAGNYTKVLTCTSPTQLTAQEIAADALTGNYSVVVGDAGGPIACTFTNTQNDTPVTLTKVWVGGITADAVSLAITGVTGSVAAVDGASIVDGAASDATATALVGDTVTLTEAFTTGDAGNYTKVLTCTSPTQLTAQEIAADALTGNYSVVVGDAGGPIACTFTNTQNDTPVTLTKVWVDGITADAVSLTITGASGMTTSGSSVVGTAVVMATADASVGDTVTLTEAFTTGDAGNYTKVLICTSPTQTAQVIAADALTGNYSVVVGDAGGPIACTFTNTQNDTPVTLTKVWVDGITADAVSLTITGASGMTTSGSSVVGTAVVMATADASVGDTVTLTEAFTTGDAGNYTKVLTCTSPTQTAQVIAADALTGDYAVVVGDEGGPIACTFTNTQNDTPVTLTKVWVGGITADAVSLAITGVTGSVAAVDGASIVDGAASDATATALVGDTVTLTEAFTTGDAGNYTKVLTCTSPTQLTAQEIAADALTGNYSVVVGDAGGPIACTFTNTQNDTPVTLTKVWVGGITADAVSLAITGVTGSVAAVDGASIVDGAASDATATALVGDTVTLTEAFTTGDAGNYTKVLTCTSPTQLTAQEIAADALTGNYSVVVGDAGGPIACTFTNTQNDTPVTLTKVWVGGITADAVSLAITGVTGSVAAVDGASIVDGAASDATATALVGDTVTLTEAFTTGDAGNYTKVLTCTSPTQLTAQEIAADALTGNYSVVVGDAGGPIACTFTNTQNDTPVTLTKVWVGGITADAVSLAITGVTGSVAAVDGASIVDGAASDATATALVGDTVTLTEAFTTGDAGNYTKVLTCTSPTQLTAQEIAADALTGNYSVVVGDAGGPIACTFTNTQNDTPVTLTKVWVGGITADAVSLAITGVTGSVAAVDGASIVDGAASDATATATALVGDTVTLTEAFTTGDAGNYTKVLTCTSPTQLTAQVIAADALTGNYSVVVGDAGGPIACTFTNTQNDTPVTLTKVWVGGITADAVSLAITGVTGSVAAVDGASIVDGAASDATATALVGDTVTLTEAFTTGDAGNYTKVLTCTSPTQLTAQVIAADALTGNYSVVVGDAGGPIACTFTNTQNDTPVTLTKVWVGGITADAVSLAITGVTGSVAAVDGASIVDGAASDATATALVGDTVTLTEAFTTGDAGNYTKVLTCTSPTQLTAQEIAADALTGNYSVVVGDAGGPIACTFTNTQNDTPVTLTKVWVDGITADAVSLAITGVTGSVAAVDGTSIVDGAASDATATALVGDTVTLTEAFTTGDAGNYTKVLTCTSPTQLTAQEIAADALTGNYSVVVGDAGGPIACTFTNTQNDTPVTLTKVWVDGITADAVSLAITGVTGSVAAVDGTSIVDGAASDATATALVGDTVTLTEAFTTGDAGNYTKVLTCTSPTQLTAQEIAADALTGNYSVVVGDAGGPIACTFTNTQNDTPVTLTKVWVGGITADAVSLAITGVTGSVAAVDGASIVDGAASDATATATALVGDTVTLTEAFTTGDAGNYTKVLTCTSPTQTAQVIAADALTGNYSVVVGDAGGPIACTFTNTQNDTPVTLTKVWVGGITADAVSLAITGVTGSVAAVDGASIVDGAASDATATALVGDTVTLTEAFTTGDAGNYTKVLTCTSPTQLTAQVIAADALTGNYSVVVGDAGGPIACTFTNTQNDTPVTLTKVWVGGITADAVSLAITGVTGSVAAVDGASIVDGAASDATATALVGDTVTLTEAFTTGDAGNYTKVLTCTSPTQTAQVIAADALTGNYSVVVGDAGGPIACTFTNTQNDTPVTLTKVWVDGITADAVSLAITGVTGSVAAVDGASIVDGAASDATATALVGDTVTLTEAFTTGDAGNYTKVLTCTSPTQLTAQEIAADALTGNYSVVVGDAGGPIACTFTNTQNDTPVTLTKVWVDGIAADAVSLAITGVTGSVAAVDGASIVDGAASDATATALVGDTVTLTEAFTTGDAGNYTKVLTCTSPTQLTAQVIAADALTGNYSVVVGDAGGPIACTFTNTQNDTPVTLTKVWVGGITADAVSLAITGVTGSVAAVDGASIVDGAASDATATALVGDTVTLTEAFTTGDAGNYTKVLTCTSPTQTAQVIAADALTGNYSVVVGDAGGPIACTFTNTQNDTPVTLTKVWVDGIAADAVSLAITGVTGSVAAVDGASIVDGAASDATATATALVGDTVTLTEAFTTGDAGNYTKVLTCTSPTQTAQVIAADALTGNYSVVVGDAGGPIACTFTNTQNDTPVTLTKVWVDGITADAVSLAITGVTGSVAAVDGASIVDGAASDATATATALVGDTVTLTEAFTTGDAGNYTKVLTCTSPTQTAQVIAADALTGNYSVVVGDAGGPIACTFTNTQNDTPVTLTKLWINGNSGDVVELEILGGTGSVPKVDGSAMVGAQPMDATATATALAGDTLTFAEEFTTGIAENYTKTLTCTSPAIDGVLEVAENALTGQYIVKLGDIGGPIDCTFTNDFNLAELTLIKVVDIRFGYSLAQVSDFVLEANTDIDSQDSFSGLSGASSVTNVDVIAGIYNLDESEAVGSEGVLGRYEGVPTGWDCLADGNGTFTGSIEIVRDPLLPPPGDIMPGRGTGTLEINPGDDVVCTLINQETQPLPVSLTWVQVSDQTGPIVIEWETVTEVGNAGFALYYKSTDAEWLKIDNGVFVSTNGDGTTSQRYQYEVQADIQASSFAITEVNIRGQQKINGPYMLNQSIGKLSSAQPTDWEKIKQSNTRTRESKEKNKAELGERRMQKLNNRMSPVERQNKQKIHQGGKPMTLHKSKQNSWFAMLLGAVISSAHATDAETLLNFEVAEAGVVKVSHLQLIEQGIDLSGFVISRIGLTNRVGAIPVRVGGFSDETYFDENSYIEFVGEAYYSIYADKNIYTLTLGDEGSATQVINSDEAIPNGYSQYSYLEEVRHDPQQNYSYSSPDENDSWFAEKLYRDPNNENPSITIDLSVDHYAPRVFFPSTGGASQVPYQSAKISADMWGASTSLSSELDHLVHIGVNNNSVAVVAFDGFNKNNTQKQLSDSVIGNGNNQVTLAIPPNGQVFDRVNVDKVILNYPRRFVSRDGQSLFFQSSGQKFTVTGFTNPVTSIYRKGEDGSVEFLSNYNQRYCDTSYGCTVTFAGNGELAEYYVATSEDISSAAISDAPEQVDLLSGSAEYLIISHPLFIEEINNHAGYLTSLDSEYENVDVVSTDSIYAQYNGHIKDANAIRAYIKDAAALRGTNVILLVGADNYDYHNNLGYNAVSYLPSVYGKISQDQNHIPLDSLFADVNDDNLPDLQLGRLPVRTTDELHDLLIKRDSYQNRNYKEKALFVADMSDSNDFATEAEFDRNQFFQDWTVSTAYRDEASAEEVRDKIVNQINNGTSLVSYYGHSSRNRWSYGVFDSSDLPLLNNSNKPTIVTQWGCWNTYHVEPSEEALAVQLLLATDSGAVSVAGSVANTGAASVLLFAKYFSQKLFSNGGLKLGDAILQAKHTLANRKPNNRDVILGWQLLGFPELSIH